MTGPVAHCPNCNSTAYSPDPSNGGAGRNKCLACGQASPVAGWYERASFGEFGKFATHPLEPITAEQYSALHMQSPDYFPIPDGYKWDKETGTIQPKRNVLHNSDNPDTANTTRKRNIADDAPPTHAPAPIRQYKDD